MCACVCMHVRVCVRVTAYARVQTLSLSPLRRHTPLHTQSSCPHGPVVQVAWRQFTNNSFTLEASFGGADEEHQPPNQHFAITTYEQIGIDLCHVRVVLCCVVLCLAARVLACNLLSWHLTVTEAIYVVVATDNRRRDVHPGRGERDHARGIARPDI